MLKKTIRHLLELVRFSHTLFALPFSAAAGGRDGLAICNSLRGKKSARDSGRSMTSNSRKLLGTMVKDLGPLYISIGRSSANGRGFANSLARNRRHPVVHGHGPQPLRWPSNRPGRPPHRRDQSTQPPVGTCPAGLLSVSQVITFHRGSVRLVSSPARSSSCPNRLAAHPRHSGPRIPGRLQLYEAIHIAWPHFWLGTALALSPIAAWGRDSWRGK